MRTRVVGLAAGQTGVEAPKPRPFRSLLPFLSSQHNQHALECPSHSILHTFPLFSIHGNLSLVPAAQFTHSPRHPRKPSTQSIRQAPIPPSSPDKRPTYPPPRNRDSCYMAFDVSLSFALSLGPSACQLWVQSQGSAGKPGPENGGNTNGTYLFWMCLSFFVSAAMMLATVDVLGRRRSIYRAACELYTEWCDYIQHTSIPERAKEVTFDIHKT